MARTDSSAVMWNRAKEARAKAQQISDPDVRNGWLQVAETWETLARFAAAEQNPIAPDVPQRSV